MKNLNLILNDMEETRVLLESESLNLNIDSIKYPSISSPKIENLEDINAKTIYYHGLCGLKVVPDLLSDNFKNELDINTTNQMIEISKTPTLSFHLGNSKLNISKEQMLTNLKGNMEYLVEHLNLENIDYISLENMEANVSTVVITPEFINEAIKITNTYFLLDIAHAYIAANILNMDPFEYIKKLPLNKVKEIHFAGTKKADYKIYSHIRCTKHDYELLEKILPLLPNIESLTLEYGTPAYKNKNNPNRTKFSLSLPRVSYDKLNIIAYQEIITQINIISKILKRLGFTINNKKEA